MNFRVHFNLSWKTKDKIAHGSLEMTVWNVCNAETATQRAVDQLRECFKEEISSVVTTDIGEGK